MKHPPRNIDQSCFDWQKIILQKTDLPYQSKYLALYLASYMNMNRDFAYPGLRTIERETGMGHATVLKYLNLLVSEGWIGKQSGDRETTNRYWITFPEGVGQELTYVRRDVEVGREVTHNNNRITNSIRGWKEWAEYRAEIKKKMTPATVEKQIKFLERYDPETQQDIINQSIQNGWTGLFSLKSQHNPKAQPAGSTRGRTLEQDLTDRSWAE